MRQPQLNIEAALDNFPLTPSLRSSRLLNDPSHNIGRKLAVLRAYIIKCDWRSRVHIPRSALRFSVPLRQPDSVWSKKLSNWPRVITPRWMTLTSPSGLMKIEAGNVPCRPKFLAVRLSSSSRGVNVRPSSSK